MEGRRDALLMCFIEHSPVLFHLRLSCHCSPVFVPHWGAKGCNHTPRVQLSPHMLTYCSMMGCMVQTPGSTGPCLTQSALCPFLCSPEPDYSPVVSRLKPLSPVAPLLHHSRDLNGCQTQSAHLASNQTIPKIDKQLWVRTDVQMGKERNERWK